MNPRGPIRVLVAKPGLDGHDVGAKVVCRALMDAGMEVIYTGLRRSPGAIAHAAVQEDVDVVGLSMLSGSHLTLGRRVMEELERLGGEEILVVAGGNIPPADRDPLREVGVAEVFPTGAGLEEIVEFIRERVPR